MVEYLIKLLIFIPLVGGLAFGTLWLWRKMQPGIAFGQKARAIKLVDTIPVGTMGRLAVVEFANRHFLVSVSRGRIELIAEAPVGAAFSMPDED